MTQGYGSFQVVVEILYFLIVFRNDDKILYEKPLSNKKLIIECKLFDIWVLKNDEKQSIFNKS